MLVIKLPGEPVAPPTPTHGTWGSPSPIPAHTDIYKEALRRDRVVRDLYSKCPYKVGEVCFISTSGKKSYGTAATILSIAKCYADLGKDYEWKNDNPMIVYAISDTGQHFFCSVDYLTRSVIQNGE